MKEQTSKLTSFVISGFRKSLTNLLFPALCIIGLFVIGSVFLWNYPPFPSDNAMIECFNRNRALFNQALTMVRQDKEIVDKNPIGKNWTTSGLTVRRNIEYQTILRTIGGYGLMVVHPDKGCVIFVIANKFSGDVKGYVYLSTPPKVVRTSLDDWLPFGFWSYHKEPLLSNKSCAFRALGDNWYLWREAEYFEW